MKKHQRKLEAVRVTRSLSPYNYSIRATYPSGSFSEFSTNDSELFDEVRDLETGIISVSLKLWRSIGYKFKL